MTQDPQQSAPPGEQQQSQGQDPPGQQQQSQGQDPPGQQQQSQGQDPPGQQQQYLPAQQQQYQEYQGQYPQGAEPGWSLPPKQPTSQESTAALIIVGAVVACGLVLAVTGRQSRPSGPGVETPPTQVQQAAPSSVPASASSSGPAAYQPPPTVVPAVTQRDYDFPLGEPFHLGTFSYVFTGVDLEDAVGNRFARQRATDGAVFLLVRYTETNLGNETATVLAGMNMRVTDAQGRTFRPSSNAMTALAMSGAADLLASELQPGIRQRSVVAFEVPQDSARSRLILSLDERGFLSTGQKRVLLRSPVNENGSVAWAQVANPVFNAAWSGAIAEIRGMMTSEDSANCDDATLAAFADNLTKAVDARGDRQPGSLKGMFDRPSPDVSINGQYVTTSIKFRPPNRPWQPRDGQVTITSREVGGRFYFVRGSVDPPREARGRTPRRQNGPASSAGERGSL